MKQLITFPCLPNKAPATENGLYDAKPHDQWETNATLFGLPTGAVNGYVVVDIDKKYGGLEEANKYHWDCNYVVDTPSGGEHLYYKYEQSIDDIRNKVGFLPGIDFRTNGGYVCIYQIVPDASSLNAMPDWLKAKLREKSTILKDVESGKRSIAEGGRNDYLSRVAGRMQKLGVLTFAALNEINEKDCEVPLEESEVQQIVESISRYAPDSTPEEDPIPENPIVWANEMLGTFFEYLRDKGKVMGDPTAIEELNDLLGGGKRLGELTVTMAEAKSGKNTLWHFLQRKQLDDGVAIGYASRELTPETEVLPNLLTLKLGKNIYTATDLSEEEVLNAIKNWKLAFAPGIGPFISADALFSWMDACRAHDIHYFYIDHLHHCLPDAENYSVLSEFGRRLKTYAKKHTVHIDLIIQPKGLDPMMPMDLDIHHLRGGASLGQVLDTLITMQRQRDDEGTLVNVTKVQTKRVRFKLAKNGAFYLSYNKDLMSFRAFSNREAAMNDALGHDFKREDEEQPKVFLPPQGFTNSHPRSEAGLLDGSKLASNIIRRIRAP